MDQNQVLREKALGEILTAISTLPKQSAMAILASLLATLADDMGDVSSAVKVLDLAVGLLRSSKA
jgi:hypothetical protein